MKKLYDKIFYKNVNYTALSSAEISVPIILKLLPKTESVVDFGCGQGAWLSVFKKNGINSVQGFDGEWVNSDGEKLLINKTEFSYKDLSEFVYGEDDKKYDLAISLEVAEHLPKKSAELFVKSLTSASDNVIFSAAIPYQGGTEHINEQWPDYWANLFAKQGFVCYDVLREKLWENKKVAPYYSQNILFYRKENLTNKPYPMPQRLVHPNLSPQRIVVKLLGRKLTNIAVRIKNSLQLRKNAK